MGLFLVALAILVIDQWGSYVMRRAAFASALARREEQIEIMKAEGRPAAEIRLAELPRVVVAPVDSERAPDWASLLTMATTVIAVGLLVWSLLI